MRTERSTRLCVVAQEEFGVHWCEHRHSQGSLGVLAGWSGAKNWSEGRHRRADREFSRGALAHTLASGYETRRPDEMGLPIDTLIAVSAPWDLIFKLSVPTTSCLRLPFRMNPRYPVHLFFPPQKPQCKFPGGLIGTLAIGARSAPHLEFRAMNLYGGLHKTAVHPSCFFSSPPHLSNSFRSRKMATSSKWTAEEDSILVDAVLAGTVIFRADLGCLFNTRIPAGSRICWNTIAERLQGRSNKSCRKRWIHSLDPSLRKGSTTSQLPPFAIVLITSQADGQPLKTRF